MELNKEGESVWEVKGSRASYKVWISDHGDHNACSCRAFLDEGTCDTRKEIKVKKATKYEAGQEYEANEDEDCWVKVDHGSCSFKSCVQPTQNFPPKS